MDSAKKVLILAGIFPPDIGGPAVYSERLACELSKRGIAVAVVSYGDYDSGANLKRQNHKKYDFPVIMISRKRPGAIRWFLYLWKVLSWAKNYDILYAQTLFSAGIPGLIASKLLRKKLVVKIVGDHAWERLNSGSVTLEDFQKQKYNRRIELLRKAQACLLKKVSKIITPSRYLKKVIFGWGVPSEKIEVIYNAASEFFNVAISREEAKSQLALQGDVLLSAGRLVAWKGFDCLIEIMPELLNENPELSLLIIGEGPERENLKLKIEKLKLTDRVRLTGKVAHETMPLYFKAADIFVLNTNYEGFSHVILEAMAAGLPVITTNVGGNPELIESGENGILTEYNDKARVKESVLILLKDKVQRERFVISAREKAETFNWQRLVDKTLKAFNSL